MDWKNSKKIKNLGKITADNDNEQMLSLSWRKGNRNYSY